MHCQKGHFLAFNENCEGPIQSGQGESILECVSVCVLLSAVHHAVRPGAFSVSGEEPDPHEC